MSFRWAALMFVLALSVLTPERAAGQQTATRGSRPDLMGGNYPNPFNPETTIRFGVGEITGSADGPMCVEPNQQQRVTIRIYNILSQLVATPVFAGVQRSGPGSSSASGQKVNNLLLPCGMYEAFWVGKYEATGREAGSGVYFWALFLDGKLIGTRRMFAAK